VVARHVARTIVVTWNDAVGPVYVPVLGTASPYDFLRNYFVEGRDLDRCAAGWGLVPSGRFPEGRLGAHQSGSSFLSGR
jgi:hypothetical protein